VYVTSGHTESVLLCERRMLWLLLKRMCKDWQDIKNDKPCYSIKMQFSLVLLGNYTVLVK
jgi:hypothetical protein